MEDSKTQYGDLMSLFSFLKTRNKERKKERGFKQVVRRGYSAEGFSFFLGGVGEFL
jgi:hypothetical protein